MTKSVRISEKSYNTLSDISKASKLSMPKIIDNILLDKSKKEILDEITKKMKEGI